MASIYKMNRIKSKIALATESKSSAKKFNYGNILAVLIPFPFFIFWFGASMFIYALYRQHPNPRVGYYTQKAAYYYYGLAGVLVPVLTFAPGDFFQKYWWALWALCALALIPLSLFELKKINDEEWIDVEYN